MLRVTKNNLIRLVKLKKEYIETGDKKTLAEINTFIHNVINKDKSYYHKLCQYNFDNKTLKYLL